MAKRPQKTAKYTGMPNISPNVVANPLDTAVVAGKEGMPAAPGGLARPAAGPDIAAPVNNQAAIDGRRTAAAFSGLSQSLKGAAFAREEYLDMLDTEGSQLSAYIDFSNNEKLVFTKALSNGQIQAMDHPRFQAALAEGAARQRAGLIKSIYKEDSAKLRAGDEAYNIDAYDAALTGIYEAETKSYKGPREDVYQAELQAAFNSQKDFLISGERKWISENSLIDAEKDLRSTVTSALENVQTLERDTIVVQQSLNPDSDMAKFLPDGYRKTVDVIGETDAKYYDRQVQTAADQLTATLDGRRGDLLSSSNMNLIIGRHLLEVAKNSPKMSRFAEEVLKRTETGPIGNRSKLLSGELKDEYLLAEKSITSTQGKFNKSSANRQFRSGINALEESLVDNAVTNLTDRDFISPEAFTLALTNDIFQGEAEKTLPDGTVMSLVNDNIVFSPPEGSGADTDVKVPLDRFQKKIKETVVRNQMNVELEAAEAAGIQLTDTQAMAYASSTTRVPHEALKAQLNRGMGLSNQFERITNIPEEGTEDRERWDGYVSTMRDNLSIFKVLEKSRSLELNGVTKETREFYEALDVISSDDYARMIGGATLEDALLSLGNRDPIRGASQWETFKGNELLAESLQSEGVNAGFAYVDKMSRVMLNINPLLDPQSAIDLAITSYKSRFKELGDTGVKYDSHEWSPDFDTGVTEWEKGDWDFAASILSTAFGGSKESYQLQIETIQQTGLMTPDILNSAWDAMREGATASGSISENISDSFWEIAAHANYRAMLNIREGSKKPIGWTDVLQQASQNLMELPSRDFSARFQTVGVMAFEDFKFIPIEGTKGEFYSIVGTTVTGVPIPILNPNTDANGNSRPFSRADIVELYHKTPPRATVDEDYMTEEDRVEAVRDLQEETGDITGGPTYD